MTSALFVYSNIELTRARLKTQYGRSCLHRARNARSRKEKELVRSLAIYFVQTFIFTFRALVYIGGSWESSFVRIRNLFVFTSQEPLRFYESGTSSFFVFAAAAAAAASASAAAAAAASAVAAYLFRSSATRRRSLSSLIASLARSFCA